MKASICLLLICSCVFCMACSTAGTYQQNVYATVSPNVSIAYVKETSAPVFKEHALEATPQPTMKLAMGNTYSEYAANEAAMDVGYHVVRHGVLFLENVNDQAERKQIQMTDFEIADWLQKALTEKVNAELDTVEGEKWVLITYYISHQSETLLSLLIQLEIEDAYLPKVIPLTFDMQEKRECKLEDFFQSDEVDDTWRRILPDIVTEQADQQGITLLSELPPTTDAQQFYIEEGTIVLLYRPYEITTYQVGIPQFALPMDRIKEYLNDRYGLAGDMK